MEVSWLLVQQIASMVLMGLAGYGVGKLKLITGEQSRVLSCMCIYLAVPCSLMTSFNTAMEADKLTGLLLALGAAVLLHLLYLALNGLMNRSGHGLAPEEQASVIYNNAGNLILPMVMAILGQEYVIYTSVYILVQNILMWTHGQKLMGVPSSLIGKKIVTTPAIRRHPGGTGAVRHRLRLPGPLVTAMEGLGSCMAPLSMLVIGILFSELDLKRVLCQGRIYWVAGLRLLVYPLLSMACSWPLRVLWPHSDGDNVLLVSLLCAIGPAASAITQMAPALPQPQQWVCLFHQCAHHPAVRGDHAGNGTAVSAGTGPAVSRGPGLFRRPEIRKKRLDLLSQRSRRIFLVQSSSFARRSRSWSRESKRPQRRGSSSGVGGSRSGDHGHPHPRPGGGEDAVSGVLHRHSALRGGPQGPAGHKVDLRVRLAVRHLIPGDDGGKTGTQAGHLHPPLCPGAAGGGGQGGGDAPAPQQLQHLPHAGLHRDALRLHPGLGAGGTGRHKCVLGKLRPKEIFHFLKNVGTVLAHELQIGFSHLGPAHFPADGQPGLLGETLGVEQHPVYIKDDAFYLQAGHTFPMSVRKCMSWKEMGLQAA